MNRKKAIEIFNKTDFLVGNHWNCRELNNNEKLAKKILLSTAKQMEEVTIIVKREIEEIENCEPLNGEQKLVLHNLNWFYRLLTEEAE